MAVLFSAIAVLFSPIAVLFSAIAVLFSPIAVLFSAIAVLFSPIAVLFSAIAVLFSPIAVLFSAIAVLFSPMAVLFSLIAVVFLPIFSVFAAMLSELAFTRVVKFVISVAFFVTLSLNACAKPTVTVGASSLPPTVTVVSSVVPRNLTLLFLSFPRLTAFVLVPSVTLNFAEILVIAVLPSLMLVMTSPVMYLANFALSTPYLMVAPSLATVSPCSSFSTSKVATLLVLSMV